MKKELLTNLIVNFAILTACSSGLLFIFGHLAAHFYYSSLGLNYIELTSLEGGFIFALKSPAVILSLLLIPFLYLVPPVVFNMFHGIINSENSCIKKVKYSLILLFIFISSIFAVTSIQNKYFVQDEEKDKLRNKLFIPYEVIYNRGNSTLTCVKPLGNIGDYFVFIDSSLKPTLILQDSILNISPLFLPVPQKNFTTIKSRTVNKNYDKELLIWNNKWGEICGDKSSNFKTFDFKDSPLPDLMKEL